MNQQLSKLSTTITKRSGIVKYQEATLGRRSSAIAANDTCGIAIVRAVSRRLTAECTGCLRLANERKKEYAET